MSEVANVPFPDMQPFIVGWILRRPFANLRGFKDRAMERRLVAILAADVVGYSRLMETDEVRILEALKATRNNLINPKIAEYHGRVWIGSWSCENAVARARHVGSARVPLAGSQGG
jgi:class 3 adenylate cyclase